MTKTGKYLRAADSLLSRLRVAESKVQEEEDALAKSQRDLAAAREAQNVLQEIAKTVQQEAHKRIAAVVSKCLEIVFPESYEFQIQFEKRRGKTEARIQFLRDGEEFEPMEETGGGVVDIAAFAARVACLVLHKPSLRRLLVMDEPFRFVSPDYRERVQAMLEMLSDEMQIQFIMVTHASELRCGKVIELS